MKNVKFRGMPRKKKNSAMNSAAQIPRLKFRGSNSAEKNPNSADRLEIPGPAENCGPYSPGIPKSWPTQEAGVGRTPEGEGGPNGPNGFLTLPQWSPTYFRLRAALP